MAGEGGGGAEGAYAARLERLRGALGGLIEDLDDLALEILRDAVDAGRSQRPALERRVTRARAGLERASRLLDGGEPVGETGD